MCKNSLYFLQTIKTQKRMNEISPFAPALKLLHKTLIVSDKSFFVSEPL